MGIKECPMRRKHNKCWSENRSRYGPMKQQAHNLHCSSMEHLPNIYTKSSESSDDPHNHPNHHLSSSTALQEIAIEIDAATMTEDNSTTATSNFAFKVAADNAVVPIIRAPIHADSDEESRGVIRHMKRRSSINSNTTAETDEFSNEEAEENQPQGDYRCQCVYWHSYESGQKFLASAVAEPKNECVKIKRKRFIAADDCCSSCSRCSSCSCSHVHTSSCSSFEEWPGITSNTQSFTVSADCHRCATKRHSAVSSTDYTGNNDNPFISDEVLPQPLIQDTTDSSAPTSRRSSITTSFCSCTSNAPCCCGEDSATGQMCTAQDATIRTSSIGKVACLDVDEQHSSTLTPLTNPSSAVSTPVGEEGDVTMRSISQPLTDDTSSHSHSADYYSLSSSQPHSQTTPNKTPRHAVILQKSTEAARVDVAGETFDGEDHDKKSRKPCKHFGKHHRHKPIDVNSLLQQTIRQSAILQENSQPPDDSLSALARRKQQLRLPTQPQDLSVGSNDSSSATLTSIVTIAKFPPLSMQIPKSQLLSSNLSQPPSSVQSLSAITALCGTNGSSVVTTTTSTTSAPNSGRLKRNPKFSPLIGEPFSCDPLLNAAQERRSTEIIL
ncbi:uncharacterized protein LOC131805479 [Musca domestica]|uniref:Uncharacterized protein LOC131805479 n=1 Tax=Musca domestica TaxID=7370 RepID=A0ABM3VFU2_MUSDO|nr:uncharacterized protein LOC131805479 [Musca domestica]